MTVARCCGCCLRVLLLLSLGVRTAAAQSALIAAVQAGDDSRVRAVTIRSLTSGNRKITSEARARTEIAL